MPVVTKESLRKQAEDCRLRLDMLKDLKRDVMASLDNVTRRVGHQLLDLESEATADNTRIDLLMQKCHRAIEALENVEEKLDVARSIHDQDNLELNASLSRIKHLAFVTEDMRTRWFGLSEEDARLVDIGSTITEDDPSRPNSTTGQIDQARPVVIDGGAQSETGATSSTAQHPHSSVIVEVGSVLATGSSVPPTASENSIGQAAANTPMAEMANDYRKHIVSKGNGNPDDFCQRSVELTACRTAPLKCTVSHAEHPSLFFVHLHNSNVNQIEDELNIALESEATQLSNPTVGDYCVAHMEKDSDLHRAKILEITNNGSGVSFSKLFYIDWGVVDWIATKALLELPQRSRFFLRQACPCSLAEVEPISGYWDSETVSLFQQITNSHLADNEELVVTSLDVGDAPEINTVSLSRPNKPASGATVVIALIRSANGKVKRSEPMAPMTAFPMMRMMEWPDGRSKNNQLIGGSIPPDVTDGWRCVVTVSEVEIASAKPESVGATASSSARTRKYVHVGQDNTDWDRERQKVVHGSVPDMSYEELSKKEPLYFRVVEWKDKSQFEFYAQLCDQSGRNGQLKAMSDALEEFYEIPSNQQKIGSSREMTHVVHRLFHKDKMVFFRVQVSNFRPGPGWDDSTLRNTITGEFCWFTENTDMDAFYVDYGFFGKVNSKNVWPLDRRFCGLPAQLIPCKLFDIQPRSSKKGFDQNAVDILENILKGQPLLKGFILNNGPPFEIVAYRADGSDGETSINAKMVASGQVVSSSEWK